MEEAFEAETFTAMQSQFADRRARYAKTVYEDIGMPRAGAGAAVGLVATVRPCKVNVLDRSQW